jgi:hypothetical protein
VKILRSLFDFYIQSSIHVALAVTALVYVTTFEFGITIPAAYYWVAFFGTITGYNFIKYAEIAGLQHKSLITSLRKLQVFSLFIFCLLVFFLFQLNKETLLVIGFFSLFTVLYVIPFIYRKNFRTLRGVKVFIVALVWAGVTVLVPVFQIDRLGTDFWLSFAQRFFIVLALIVPFEIRDLQDDGVDLRTFPQLFGVKKTKGIGFFLLVLIMVLEGFKNQITAGGVGVLFVICSLIGMSILRTKIKQSEYFASFWVESIPIVWGMVLFLFCHFLT